MNVRHRVMRMLRDGIVNGVAAADLVPGALRRAIYSAYGMRVDGARIAPRCFFGGSRVRIGAGTKINYGCFFDALEDIEIGARCAFGFQVLLCTSGHTYGPSEERNGPLTPKPIRIGPGSGIGSRATVLGGVTIGEGCMIVAGSLVHRDCRPNGLYAGIPARRVRDLPACGDEHGAALLERVDAVDVPSFERARAVVRGWTPTVPDDLRAA